MPVHYKTIDDFLARKPVNRKGRTLVIGSKVYKDKPDRRNKYQNAIGIDLEIGEGVDFIHNLENPLPTEFGTFDHIDCCSVLEHVKRPWKLCENIEAVMNAGATIVLQVPFVWRLHNYPGDYWRISTQAFGILFPSIKWKDRGYLMEDVYRKLVPSITRKNKRYLQRAEAIGFGIKCGAS